MRHRETGRTRPGAGDHHGHGADHPRAGAPEESSAIKREARAAGACEVVVHRRHAEESGVVTVAGRPPRRPSGGPARRARQPTSIPARLVLRSAWTGCHRGTSRRHRDRATRPSSLRRLPRRRRQTRGHRGHGGVEGHVRRSDRGRGSRDGREPGRHRTARSHGRCDHGAPLRREGTPGRRRRASTTLASFAG